MTDEALKRLRELGCDDMDGMDEIFEQMKTGRIYLVWNYAPGVTYCALPLPSCTLHEAMQHNFDACKDPSKN